MPQGVSGRASDAPTIHHRTRCAMVANNRRFDDHCGKRNGPPPEFDPAAAFCCRTCRRLFATLEEPQCHVGSLRRHFALNEASQGHRVECCLTPPWHKFRIVPNQASGSRLLCFSPTGTRLSRSPSMSAYPRRAWFCFDLLVPVLTRNVGRAWDRTSDLVIEGFNRLPRRTGPCPCRFPTTSPARNARRRHRSRTS